MSRGQDNTIDEAVVKIHPDLSTFNAELKKALGKQALLKDQPVYKIKVVPNAAGLRDQVRKAVAAQMLLKDQPVYKIKVVVDAKGLKKSIGDVGDITTKAAQKTEQDLVKTHAAGLRERRKAERKALEKSLAEGMAYTLKLQLKTIEKSLDRVRTANEKHQREELAAREAEYKRQNTRLRNLAEKLESDLATAIAAEKKRHNSRVRSQDEKDEKDHAEGLVAEKKRTNTLIRNEDEKFEKEQINAVGADIARTVKKNVAKQRSDETYLSFTQHIADELAKIEQGRALDEIGIHYETQKEIQRIEREGSKARIALLAADEKIENDKLRRVEEAEKASTKRRAATKNSLLKSQQFIDFGGEGIRPMNALYGVVVAMTPALFAMGASAVQASTSIAALGSAGIGAALGLSGVMVAFQGIGDLFSLRKQVQNEEAAASANSARSSAELAQSRRSYADALRDEKTAAAGVHDARREAVRDLEDLRIAVRDLDNEYKSNQLSVREAEQNERATNANFFSTALDRARAHQDTLDARTKLSDTALQRKRKKEDLKTSVSKGVEGSDKVKAAKERARDARDATLNARDVLNKTGGSMSKTSSAAAQLEKKLKDMSPAARDMWKWFLKNEDLFKRLQRQISQQVLPGFTTFLNAITAAPKGGKSTLQLAAEYAGELGAVISKYAGKFGEFTKSGLFRGSMARIQKINADAFDKLGQALIRLADPITRILDKAAPGFGAFADKILELSDRFATFIEKSDKNGDLAQWFEDSRIEAKKWYDIAVNIGTLLKNLFMGSLPAGGSLVSDFQAFTKTLADWSGSAKGQKQIKDFFQKFQDLPYAKIADFFKNASAFFLVLQAAKFLKGVNPIILLISALAASHPELTADLLAKAFTGLSTVVEYLSDHPKGTAALLAILGAVKLGKTVGLDFKLPAMDKLRNTLTSKFKVLEQFVGGGANTATMTVHAGVVHLYGGTTGGGTTPGVDGGGTPGKNGKKPGRFATGSGSNLALSGGLALGAVLVDQIDATGATPFQQGVQDAVSGSLSGAALGTMVGGPVGTAVGAAIGAGVGLAIGAWNKRQQLLSTATGREQLASEALDRDWFNSQTKFNPLHPPALKDVIAKDSVKEWVAARKASVDLAVEQARAEGGEPAAAAKRIEETRKTNVELSRRLQLFGISKDKADAYSRAAVGLDGLIRDQNLILQDALDDTINKTNAAGGAAKAAADKYGTLGTKFNQLTGKKEIVLVIKGETKVFNDLNKAAAYQQIIRSGEEPTTANVRKYKLQIDKQAGEGLYQPYTPKGSRGIPAAAAGGLIGGYSPHDKADNIPAWLTAKEFVQPVAAVEHYGTDFMEAVRTRQFPKFASGGPVAWPFTTLMPQNAAQVAQPAYSEDIPGGGNAVGNVQVAEIAEATARSMGATTKQLLALISAGIVESGLRNISYGDRDSVGFLQQRPSQGWGTVKQLTDPAYATRKFIQAARRMDKAGISAGELAARVQRPAAQYRGRYADRQADAAAVLNRFAPYITTGPNVGTPGAGGTKAGLISFGHWLQAKGYDVTEHPKFGGVHGGHVSGSQHYRNQAIDVNHGAGTSAREQAYLRKIIPEGHRRGFRSIFMSRSLGHFDHAHFDLGAGHADGGLVPRKYDSGGVLPPGYSLAFNGTGQNETIRTDRQEKALAVGATRLDRRDLALLAQFMASAVGNPTIAMDGRKVAETTNRYNYLPTGV